MFVDSPDINEKKSMKLDSNPDEFRKRAPLRKKVECYLPAPFFEQRGKNRLCCATRRCAGKE